MATQHLTDDDLILHYYGETVATDQRNATGHLQECASCRSEYARLQRVLGVDRRDRGARSICRRHSNARCGRGSSPTLQTRAARLGGVAADVAGAAGARRRGRRARRRRLLRRAGALAVRDALAGDRGRDAGGADARAHPAHRGRRASRSIADGAGRARERGRRCQRAIFRASGRAPSSWWPTAGCIDRPPTTPATSALSQLLDEIERVLTEVAATPETGSSRDLADVRRRIESRDLLFKVRVVVVGNS